MSHLKLSKGTFLVRVMLAAASSALAFGCAATDGDGSEELSKKTDVEAKTEAASADLDALAALSEEEAVNATSDKALRTYYCCAVKRGSTVDECINMYATKVGARLACKVATTDNVVRDGTCSQYESCDFKITNPWF